MSCFETQRRHIWINLCWHSFGRATSTNRKSRQRLCCEQSKFHSRGFHLMCCQIKSSQKVTVSRQFDEIIPPDSVEFRRRKSSFTADASFEGKVSWLFRECSDFDSHFFEIRQLFSNSSWQPQRLDSFKKRSLRSRQGLCLAVYQNPHSNSSIFQVFFVDLSNT